LILQIFNKVKKANLNGLQKLKLLAEYYLNFIENYPDYYKAILTFRNHSVECAETGEVYLESMKKNAEINNVIIEIIHSGQQDGSISKKAEASKLAQAIWGNLTGFLPGCILAKNKISEQSDFEPDSVLRYIFELIQTAIKTT